VRALAILLASALGSCTCGTLTRDELAERYPYAEGTLYSRGGFAPVVTELETKLGGPLTVTSISIRPGDAFFTVRDPKRPGNLDNWSYDGKRWRDPEPVQTSRHELEDTRSFAIAEVPALGKLRDLVDRSLAELKIEQGRVEGVSVRRFKTIEISVDIKGPRERGRVTFEADGTLREKHVD
jgi:hypothetical protein